MKSEFERIFRIAADRCGIKKVAVEEAFVGTTEERRLAIDKIVDEAIRVFDARMSGA